MHICSMCMNSVIIDASSCECVFICAYHTDHAFGILVTCAGGTFNILCVPWESNHDPCAVNAMLHRPALYVHYCTRLCFNRRVFFSGKQHVDEESF